MNRGAWVAAVHGITELDATEHSCMHTLSSSSSVTQSCLTLGDPMNRSTSGLPVHHPLLEFTQTHVHRVSDAKQPSHPAVPFAF